MLVCPHARHLWTASGLPESCLATLLSCAAADLRQLNSALGSIFGSLRSLQPAARAVCELGGLAGLQIRPDQPCQESIAVLDDMKIGIIAPAMFVQMLRDQTCART